MSFQQIQSILADKAQDLLTHACKVHKEHLHLPGKDFVDRIFSPSDRNIRVLQSLQQMYNHGRLSGTGPLDGGNLIQGI